MGGDLHSDWGQKGNEEMLSLVCAHGYECLEDFVHVCPPCYLTHMSMRGGGQGVNLHNATNKTPLSEHN